MLKKQPEYFKVILNNNAFLFKPTKPDVTNFNDFSNIGAFCDIYLIQFSESERASYRFTTNICANSIVLDKNIDIQLDCNVYVVNSLQVSSNSKIIESSDSGAYII